MGPTPAQKRYEGRKDLGNVQKGDGSRFRGRGPIQVTGLNNYRAFTKWARKIDAAAPNFENAPDELTTDPWEGLSPIFYWAEGNPDGKSLNRLADRGDIENIKRKINGGLNGYDDRLRYYDRVALALLGYAVNEMPRFQADARLKDRSGTSGPLTRAALQKALLKQTAAHRLSDDVATAPVVEDVEVEVPVPVEKPVVPEKVEEKVKEKPNWLTWLTGTSGLGTIGLGWLSGMEWQAILAGGVVLIFVVFVLLLLCSQIIAAVRQIKAEVAE